MMKPLHHSAPAFRSLLSVGALTSLALLQFGCTNVTNSEGEPLVRMLVEQGHHPVVVELDSTRNVTEVNYSLGRERYATIHSAGNQALMGDKDQKALVSLVDGSVNTLGSRVAFSDPVLALPSGAGYVARSENGNAIQLLGITGVVRSSTAIAQGESLLDIAVCDNSKTVLAITAAGLNRTNHTIHSYQITNSVLNHTHSLRALSRAHQIECAPASNFAAYIGSTTRAQFSPQQLNTVNIDATGNLTANQQLNPVTLGAPDPSLNQAATPRAVNLAFSPDGDHVYVRMATLPSIGAQGWLEKFSIENRRLATTTWSASIPPYPYQSIDLYSSRNIAIHPNGSELYFPYDNLCDEVPDHQGGVVKQCQPGIMIIDANTGNVKPAIFHPSITKPSRVTVETVQCLDVNNDGC